MSRSRAQSKYIVVSPVAALKNTLLTDHIVKPYSIGTERSRCNRLI